MVVVMVCGWLSSGEFDGCSRMAAGARARAIRRPRSAPTTLTRRYYAGSRARICGSWVSPRSAIVATARRHRRARHGRSIADPPPTYPARAAANPPRASGGGKGGGRGGTRQLTVMFCDLVGSTALSATLRPRGSARDRSAPITAASPRPSAVRRLCRQIHGRRRLIYFGYPEAHEDDAERGSPRRARRDRGGRPARGAGTRSKSRSPARPRAR